MLVQPDDDSYGDAQRKLMQVQDSLDKETIDSAVAFYIKQKYVEAENVLRLVSDSSRYALNSYFLLTKMDSIRIANRARNRSRSMGQLDEQSVNDVDRNLSEKTADVVANLREEKLKDPKLNQLRKQVKVLFEQLLEFKNRSDFHMYGFIEGYKYNKWLKQVKALKESSLNVELLGVHGFVVGNLETLGVEYALTNGEESELTGYMTDRIRSGLEGL